MSERGATSGKGGKSLSNNNIIVQGRVSQCLQMGGGGGGGGIND